MQFSILTVHYNQGPTLLKLFNSLLPQKEYIKELIIYDDGSDESHIKVLKSLTGLKVKLILAHHKGKLLSHHFNRALEFATGDVFMQIFADTYIAEDGLRKLSETYIKDSVGCGYEYLVNSAGQIVANDYRMPPTDDIVDLTGRPKCYFAITGNSLIAPVALTKKLKADERFEGYGKEDTDLTLRLFMNGCRVVMYNNVKVFHPNEKSEPDNEQNTKLLRDKIEGHGLKSDAQVVTLDFDDFGLENNQRLYLEKLKSIYPNIKISMFMIPWDYKLHNTMQDFQRQETIQWIRNNLSWIELIPHGLTHKEREFENLNYEDYDVIFGAIDEAFRTYNLPYIRGFKAPYWLYNQSLVNYLDKKGWFLATDRNQMKAPRAKRNFTYTHSIDEPYWLSKQDEIHLHGHISLPSTNNLPDNIMNLLKINPDAEWKFISDLFKEQEEEEREKNKC